MKTLEEAKLFATLGELSSWALTQNPPKVFPDSRLGDINGIQYTNYPGFDVLIQDEYTHDIIVPFDNETYLVYDST